MIKTNRDIRQGFGFGPDLRQWNDGIRGGAVGQALDYD